MCKQRAWLPAALMLTLTLFLFSGCGPDQAGKTRAVVGQPAPTFDLTDLYGKKWSLADLRGQVVFLNFWATWCQPCLQEMPSMAALNQRMAGKPFQMITVLYNDRPEYAWNLVKKTGYTFPVLLDGDGTVSNRYGLTGVPETYIIDSQGVLVEKFIGPVDWNSAKALALLGKYMPPPPSPVPAANAAPQPELGR